MSADPLTVHGLGADANAYAYVRARTMVDVDPDGLNPIAWAVAIGVGIMGASQYANAPERADSPLHHQSKAQLGLEALKLALAVRNPRRVVASVVAREVATEFGADERDVRNLETAVGATSTIKKGSGTAAKRVPPEAKHLGGEPVARLPRVSYSMKDAKAGPVSGDRNTAILRAWRQEVELVRATGRGSIDWTAEEVAAIKAGKSFKDLGYTGHHINRVQDAPEWKGDPRNIEFMRQGKGQDHMTKGHPGGTAAKQPEGLLIDRPAMLENAKTAAQNSGDN